MNDRLQTNKNALAKEVWELFETSEDARKVLRKVFMKFIDMSTEYKKYTMDLDVTIDNTNIVTTYYLSLRKNCSSNYKKRLISLNKNYIINTGVGRYRDPNGIDVKYELEELCRLFLREYKIIELVYGK